MEPPLDWFARAAGCGAAKLADEQLLVAVRGQEILGGTAFSLVCNGHGCGAAKLAVCTAAAEARQWWLPCFTGLVI